MAGRILVVGATGTVGSQLVTQLDQRGEKVRAATREPAAARRRLNGAAELVKFDFERPETFAPALDGADRVFLCNSRFASRWWPGLRRYGGVRGCSWHWQKFHHCQL